MPAMCFFFAAFSIGESAVEYRQVVGGLLGRPQVRRQELKAGRLRAASFVSELHLKKF
jgi:hypothetical protein